MKLLMVALIAGLVYSNHSQAQTKEEFSHPTTEDGVKSLCIDVGKVAFESNKLMVEGGELRKLTVPDLQKIYQLLVKRHPLNLYVFQIMRDAATAPIVDAETEANGQFKACVNHFVSDIKPSVDI